MIREDKFVVSRQRYAVDPASLRPAYERTSALGPGFDAFFAVNAVWFRRRDRITAACVGEIWDLQKPSPDDVVEFLTRHDDGRYGGRCRSRWDGESFWSESQDPDVTAADLALLRPMLDAYPQIPDGFDGWWRF